MKFLASIAKQHPRIFINDDVMLQTDHTWGQCVSGDV